MQKQQTESDEKMERIRKMEEDTQKIHNAITKHKEKWKVKTILYNVG